MNFTCVLKQNAATVASTTTSATYMVRDGWCTALIYLTATASGSAGTEVKVTPTGLPAPLAAAICHGSFAYNDAGTAVYAGVPRWDGTDIKLRVHNASTELGQTPSFTVANTDTLSILLKFPVA